MGRLRQTAAALMLLSGVTHSAHFLLSDASSTNTPSAAGFGVFYLVIGVLLLRPGSIGPWLGAIVVGIGAVLGGLVALGSSDPLAIFHAVINWVVFPICITLLVRNRAGSDITA
jgi:hypothetical protein